MKYVTKPAVIEAVQYTGLNWLAIARFINYETDMRPFLNHLEILTLEGVMRADPGDYIIKGLLGEFYPCKPEAFNLKYNLLLEDNNNEI